jgi:ribosomal peptide maturation radical SAM protein 1
MPHIPGIFSRDSAVTSGPLTDMDSLPYPDYTDYFAQFKAHIGACDFQPLIPLETARGCWWAQIQPCTFCSLNSSSPIFRSKAPERVQDEISRLRHNYPGHSISVADTVLDYRYFKTLLPKLAAQQVHFIWETRTNFRREHFALMAQAGITQVQLGIESFSDAILRLMHKGATRIQNIQALKWCQQFGILASWNFLYGFPGEDPAEYVAMQNLTPLLFHLTAPWGWVHIRFERTSAYLNSPATYGVTRVSPSRAYQYVYHGLSPDQVAQIAYYFDAEYDDDSATYTQGVGQTVKEWQTRTDAALGVSPEPQSIRIVDTRTRGETREYHFDGLAAELYLLCDAAQSVRALMDAPSVRARAAEAEVVATLNQFVERGLMIREGKQYLSLAIVRDAALAASSTAQSQ